MNLGMEVDLNVLKKISTEYAEAKKQAIEEASEVVDVQNVKHIAVDKELMRDLVEKIADNWNVKREVFYQQIRLNTISLLKDNSNSYNCRIMNKAVMKSLEENWNNYYFRLKLEIRLAGSNIETLNVQTWTAASDQPRQ